MIETFCILLQSSWLSRLVGIEDVSSRWMHWVTSKYTYDTYQNYIIFLFYYLYFSILWIYLVTVSNSLYNRYASILFRRVAANLLMHSPSGTFIKCVKYTRECTILSGYRKYKFLFISKARTSFFNTRTFNSFKPVELSTKRPLC